MSDSDLQFGPADQAVVADSGPLDFDALIGESPALQRAARTASTVAAFGDGVRRARLAAGLSQAALAERAGMTQAHISELERGLGSNGPTVGTLSRLMQDMGDELLFDTVRSRAEREADARRDAESLIAQMTAQVAREGAANQLDALTSALMAQGAALEAGEARNNVIQGVVMGLRATRLPAVAEPAAGLTPAARAAARVG
jgi:transcriptional regulator with XRE-family HTH domain